MIEGTNSTYLWVYTLWAMAVSSVNGLLLVLGYELHWWSPFLAIPFMMLFTSFIFWMAERSQSK